MLDGLEGGKGVTDYVALYAGGLCGQGGCHGVVDVVLSAKCQALKEDVGLFVVHADNHLVVPEECALLQFFLLGEGKHLAAEDYLGEVTHGDGVVGVEDKAVVLAEVAGNVELGVDVVLHLVVVAVKMVRGDVCYDGDVRAEVTDVVQLET